MLSDSDSCVLATKAALEVEKLISTKSEQLTRTFEVLVYSCYDCLG